MVLSELLDYSTLRLIWWVLLGLLLIGFAAMDGFDLGIETMLPFVARTDLERRMVLETIEPVWEGNQVWLILAGGAIFAAWPQLYAVSFSGFYLAMFIILFALILRPVGFKYRNKRESTLWRTSWDWALFIGGFVPSLIFGVAVGNVLLGVPFRINDDMMIFYEGSFFALLNPFALLAGLMSVIMLAMHGCVWLCVKTNGTIADRARKYGTVFALLTVVFYIAAGLYLWKFGLGYRITSEIDPNLALPIRFIKLLWLSKAHGLPIICVIRHFGQFRLWDCLHRFWSFWPCGCAVPALLCCSVNWRFSV